MPIAEGNFPIPLPQERPAFGNAQELRDLLIKELTTLGWAGNQDHIQVDPTRVYGTRGYETIPGEYDVRVSHPLTKGQSWFGRVRGSPNETLMIRQGEGFQMMRGDLRTVGEQGIGEPGNVIPFYTGIQSFARRVASAFGEYKRIEAATPPDMKVRENVQSLFRQINDLQQPYGNLYSTPTGEDIQGRIPGSSVSLGSIDSPAAVRFQAGTYNVPVVPPSDPRASGTGPEAQKLRSQSLTASVEALGRQALERGLSAASPWYRLFQGFIHEPSLKSPLTFTTPWAAGSLSIEGGETVVDMLTPKPYKQTVVAGTREMAIPSIVAGRGAQRHLETIPEEFLRQSSITLRSGETPITGIPGQAVTALQALPWGSGAMQVSLPEQLREYVTGRGGQVVAGRIAHQAETLSARSITQLAESPFTMEQGLIGSVLKQGRKVTYTGGLPKGQNLAYTAGNQMEQILGYRLVLPDVWRQGMTEEQLEPWMARLQGKGFQQIAFGAGEDPLVDLMTMVATPGAFKGGGAKGQINVPLVGVDQAVQTAMGNLPYNFLQEGKNLDAVVLNALQAMEKPQQFLGTIFRGDKDMLQALTAMRKGNIPLSLEDLGHISGRYQTGEQTLSAVTQAVEAYPDQEALIRRFGMGFVGGRFPVEQYTPQTVRQAREGLLQHLVSQGVPITGNREQNTLGVKDYLRTFNRNLTFDKKTGYYTSWQDQRVLYNPKLATLVQESAGIGSNQGEQLQAMIAQGYGGIARFLQEQQEYLYPESPAKGALQNVTRAWMATNWGAPQATGRYTAVTKEMAGTIQASVAAQAAKLENPGQLQIMELYEKTMREVAGEQEGPEPIYWYPQSQTAFAGGGAFRELESLRAEITGEGGIQFQTQAQVATRFNRITRALLEGEMDENPDAIARSQALQFQSLYADSDQLRKQRGGIFSRYAGTGRLQSGQAIISDEGLRRFYLMQGGDPRSRREYARYKRIMEGATGIAERYPVPNIGSEGMPGSVQPVQIMTGRNQLGKDILGSIKQAGLMLPELITSSLYGANLGDIDYDPMTLLPLAYRTERGRWNRYTGDTTNLGDYQKWSREMVASQGPAQQQKTFNAIFGAKAAQMNPWGQNMQVAMEQMMGKPGESLLEKRLALSTQDFQKNLIDWNVTKTRDMGVSYNTYLRRPRAAGSFLNIPERLATELSDISAMPYQKAIDFSKMESFWENLMNTSGFQAQAEEGGGFKAGWGVNIAGGENFVYDPNLWNPMTQDVSRLAALTGGALGVSEMPSRWAAGMVMQIPERGEMPEADYEANLRKRQDIISRQIEQVRQRTKGGTEAGQSVAMTRKMMRMQRLGLVGERSYAGVSALARSFEYTAQDPTKRQRVMQAFSNVGGLLIGGERVPYQEAEARYRPLSNLYDFLKHTTGQRRYKTVEGVSETMLAAEQGGWTGTPVMREYRQIWGELAGFPAEGPLQVAHPVTGESMPIQTREDIEALSRVSEQLDIRTSPYARTMDLLETVRESRRGTITEGVPMRASDLAYPEGFIGTGMQERAREGTRAHFAMSQYLKQANLPEVESFEEQRTRGFISGRHDILRREGEQRTIYDLKTGTTPPEEYAGQMAAYRLLTGAKEAVIMKVPRQITEQYREEERQAAVQRGGAISDYRQAIVNTGRRIYEYGMQNTTRLTEEQTGAPVMERFVERYMAARNIAIPEAQTPAQAAETQAGMGGGGGRLPPTRPAMPTFPEPEEPQPRQTAGQVMGNVDLAEVAQIFARAVNAGQLTQRQLMFGRRTPYNPRQANVMWQATEHLFSKYMGRFGEADELEPGSVTQSFQNMPELLSQMFPQGETRARIAGMTPLEAIQQAPVEAQGMGINFKRAFDRIPGLESARQQFATLTKFITPTMRAMDMIEPSTYQGGMVQRALRAITGGSAAEEFTRGLGPAGIQLSDAYTGMQQLQMAYSGTRAGRVGEQPVSEARADLGRRWLASFDEMTQAIDKQTQSIATYKGRQLELNEVIQRGEELTGKHHNTFLRYNKAFEESEYKRDKAAEKLTRKAGWEAPVARALTREEMGGILAGAPKEEVETAFDQYEAAEGRARMARLQLSTAAMQPGKAIPGAEGPDARDFGRLARATMGGFGLMYLRSVGDIITGGSQLGYQPYMEQQQMMAQMVGQQMGGMPAFFGPEQRLQQAQTLYAGSGYAALRNMQTGFYQDPQKAARVGMLQAALGAGGAGLWMGAMIGAPWLGAVGALAAPPIVTALNIAGATQEPEATSQAMAARIWGGQTPAGEVLKQTQMYQEQMAMPPGYYPQWLKGLQQQVRQQDWFKQLAGFGVSGDQQFAGLMASPEGQRQLTTLLDVRKQVDQGKTAGEALRGMGYDRAQVNQWLTRYYTAASANMAAPPEGFVGTELLQERYPGLRLTEGVGGTREFLAGSITQQASWIQAAQQMGATPWATLQEQRARGAEFLQLWTDQRGRTDLETERLISGQQRYAGLGIAAPRTRTAQGQEGYAGRLADLSPLMYEVMQQRYAVGGQLQGWGMQWQAPLLSQFQGPVTAQTLQAQQDALTQEQIRSTAYGQVRQGFMGLGMAPGAINMQQYQGMNLGQLAQVSQQQQYAQGLQGTLANFGWNQQRAGAFGQAFAQLPQRTFEQVSGILGGNQLAFAAYMTQNPMQMMQMPLTVPGIGGTQIQTPYLGMTDIRETFGPQGQYQQQVTGMPWGMSSLAMPGVSSMAMAGRIWGQGWQGQQGLNQGLIQAMIQGGQFGGQEYQLQIQAEQARAQAGIQMQQLALTRSFQTGVGLDKYAGTVNPQTGQPFGINTGRFSVNVPGAGSFTSQGGGFWGLEDASRNLNWMQQQWGFGQQQQQLDMQGRFFMQNFNLNQQQSQMQRGWAREDWGFQDRTRAMQWGWRQEDFQEQARFMTGRDRRLAERQMGRETIMHDIEGEQIDKQRERQKDLWQLEDERYKAQLQQHKEQQKFQQDAIKMQQRFFEERKKLEEEQVKLSRAYFIEQQKLQEAQIGASVKYAEIQREIALTMQQFSKFSQTAAAEGNLFNNETLLALADALEELNPQLAELIKLAVEGAEDMGAFQKGNPKQKKDDGKKYKPYQYGGRIQAGESGLIGETEPEIYTPYFTGDIIPVSKYDPWQNGMVSPTGQRDTDRTTHIVLNIGGHNLMDIILKALNKEIDVL